MSSSQRSRTLIILGGPARYGLVADDGIVYWRVWLENANFGAQRRAEMQNLTAASALIASQWSLPTVGPVVATQMRATVFGGHRDAATWLLKQLGDLHSTGLFFAVHGQGQ